MRNAVSMAAVLIAVPAAVIHLRPGLPDCGDPANRLHRAGPHRRRGDHPHGQADRPEHSAANKSDIVTPGFSPEEAETIDDHLNRMNAGGLLPLNCVVTDIQPAPGNLARATLATTGTVNQITAPGPIVLVDQGGHWLITHDTAMTALDAFWYNANRRHPVVAPVL